MRPRIDEKLLKRAPGSGARELGNEQNLLKAGAELGLKMQDTLRIPVRLQILDKEVTGHTETLNAEGLLLSMDCALTAGTPLNLQCSFGGVCFLNLSGSVVSCHGVGTIHSVEIRFSAIRELERKILNSSIEELKVNGLAQEKSLLTLSVVKDYMALEAAYLSKDAAGTIVQSPTQNESEHLSIASGTSSENVKKFTSRRAKKFTPDPPWVVEMNQYLQPYRQAIWQSKLVQETSTGELSLAQVKGWSIQFYPFIELFPQFMATYLSKATDAMSRTFLIDNLRVEKRHADQWIDMAKGFGVPKEELFTTAIVPEVEALTHWMWSITNRGSFVEGVAATNYAIEGVTQGIAAIMVKGFVKYHGKEDVVLDKRAYYWMEAHSAYDDLHPYEALEIIKVHATTSEIQQNVRHAAQRSLEYLYRALEACYCTYAPLRSGDVKLHAV